MYRGVTLNTALAFLTSLAKVAFLVPIIEGLGQLKWMQFLSHKRRPLLDLQVFEEGTRGGLGSLKLLFSFKGQALPHSASPLKITNPRQSPRILWCIDHVKRPLHINTYSAGHRV